MSTAEAIDGIESDAPDYALEATGLTKTYRGTGGQAAKLALDHVDLKIPRGSLFGLLGPNGAGKSTFINILAGLVIKSSGTAKVWDYDIDNETRLARASIGVVPQELNIDPFFTPEELLEVQAGLYGVPKRERRTEEVLRLIGLDDKRKAYARTLSGGMRRRLDIAASLVVTPGVLFLDEPTTGLDPKARKAVWRMIRGLADAGVTILLTTQYLEEADQLAARIAVIDHGRKIAEGTSRELKAQTGSGFLHVALADRERLDEAARLLEARLASPVQSSVEGAQLSVKAGSAEIASQAIAALIEAGIEPSDFSMGQPSLDEVFFALTGQGVESGMMVEDNR
jgi:ABC-2 type transport system ATP-binding protein